MKSTEKFVRRERFSHEGDKKFITGCVIALLVSLILLAESAYFCYNLANPPAIMFTGLFSLTTLVFASLLWFAIRRFRKDDMP